MTAWPVRTIGDLCDLVAGGTPARTEPKHFGGGIPWVKIGDMLDGVVNSTEETISPAGLRESAAKVLPAGTTLLSIFATIGRTAVLGVDAATNQAIVGLTPRRGSELDPAYLRRYLDSQVPVMTGAARGVAQANLNASMVRGWPIPLPPLPEQRRIADILDKADALRAKRRAALALLDTLTQSIFLDMFGDPATNPKAWPTRQVEEVADVVTGNTPSRARPEYYGDELDWIKSDNILFEDYYVTAASERLSAAGVAVGRTAPAGSILVVCIAGSPASIGRAAMTNKTVAFNQQINALIPRAGNPHFLLGQLRANQRLVQSASTASMKGMVSKSKLAALRVIWPPVSEQDRFAKAIDRVRPLQERSQRSLAHLDALFASLQHRAFSGEL